MTQSVTTHFRRRILGSGQETDVYCQNHALLRIDRRFMEKIWKLMDRIVKYCQKSKMNLKKSPPYMLDILPDLYQTLRDILSQYENQLDILNQIEYFQIFIRHLADLCTKTIECFKCAGHYMYDEQSSYRKHFIKLSLYFSHNLTELKALFINGAYEGHRFRLTKQEAAEFWKKYFKERIIVPWEEFKEKLNLVHSIRSYEESIALQNTIDLTHNNHVSIFEFDVFIRLFHPWLSILTNWRLLVVHHPGYMAFMTYDEVKAILSNYIDKPGSYVFRLSCTRLGQWAIGYVTSQKSILQTIPQTKSLIQSLIDGERERYYKYPNGKNIHIDLSSVLKPAQSDRIQVSEEQHEIYSDIGTSFELCKICSVNDKDSKIEPCGHLLCQTCLITWQNQHSSKPPTLCPFCRSEIKGFELVVINSFDSSTKINEDTNANLDIQNSQIFTVTHSSENTLLHKKSSTPPPVPPRPPNMRCHIHRFSMDASLNNARCSQEAIRLCSESLSNLSIQLSTATENLQTTNPEGHIHSSNLTINHVEQIRNRLIAEINFDSKYIDAALVLTEGLSISKQYEMVKRFLNQIKFEREQLLNVNDDYLASSLETASD